MTLYICAGSDEWQIWECLDTPATTVTLQKLVKGQEYSFRVIAINKAGRSEPSVASRPKMAKETDRKCTWSVSLRSSNEFDYLQCSHTSMQRV